MLKFISSIGKYMRFTSFVWLLSFSTVVFAQEKQEITDADYNNTKIEMADEMRSNGKIYIVVATVCSLMAGLLVYLVVLDRKIDKIEKQVGLK